MSEGPVATIADSGGFIELFRLDATHLKNKMGKAGSLLHFTNTDAVTVGTQVYQTLPVDVDAISFDPGRAPAQPTLHISAISPAIRALIHSFGNLIGARLHMARIFSDAHWAEDEAVLDPEQVFATTSWTLDRLVSLDMRTALWSLRSDLDREGTRIPRRFLSRDHCPFTVRRWTGSAFAYQGVQCPYQGATIYDSQGRKVTDPSQEHFSRTLSDCCKRRFPARDLPFGGFPGVERL